MSSPENAQGLIVIAGSSLCGAPRTDVRRTLVAQLHRAELAVVHVDLLEAAFDHRGRLDIPGCAAHLVGAAVSIPTDSPGHHRPIGLLGQGWAAAAALWAAADLGRLASAVVCWPGRFDGVAPRLAEVIAATLFVVGDRDADGLDHELEVQGRLRCPTHLRVVPGGSDLFSQPTRLDDVEAATVAWFTRHLIDDPHLGTQPGTTSA